MATIDPLPSSKLHATYDPALIPADDSTGIRPAPMEGRTPIQDRAMKALDVALNIRSCGFNVYLAGDSYLGRQYMLTQYLRPVARKAATPPTTSRPRTARRSSRFPRDRDAASARPWRNASGTLTGTWTAASRASASRNSVRSF